MSKSPYDARKSTWGKANRRQGRGEVRECGGCGLEGNGETAVGHPQGGRAGQAHAFTAPTTAYCNQQRRRLRPLPGKAQARRKAGRRACKLACRPQQQSQALTSTPAATKSSARASRPQRASATPPQATHRCMLVRRSTTTMSSSSSPLMVMLPCSGGGGSRSGGTCGQATVGGAHKPGALECCSIHLCHVPRISSFTSTIPPASSQSRPSITFVPPPQLASLMLSSRCACSCGPASQPSSTPTSADEA